MGNLLSTPLDAHSLVERPVSTPPPEVQPVEPNPVQTSVQPDEPPETKPQTNVSFYFYFL